MRTHVQRTRVGQAVNGHWIEVGVIPISPTGYHYTGRASTSADTDPEGRVELRGQAGKTVLWSGPLTLAAKLVDLPVTLPGERLVFMAQAQKSAQFTFELAWVEPGETTPQHQGAPCAP